MKSTVQAAGLLCLGLLLMDPVHELGHAVTAMLAGLEILDISLAPWERAHVVVSGSAPDWWMAIISISGMLACLLIGLLGLALCRLSFRRGGRIATFFFLPSAFEGIHWLLLPIWWFLLGPETQSDAFQFSQYSGSSLAIIPAIGTAAAILVMWVMPRSSCILEALGLREPPPPAPARTPKSSAQPPTGTQAPPPSNIALSQ